MSDNNSNQTGKHRQRFEPCMNNPEKVKKTDWWDELCAKHDEENHWNKDKPKPDPKDK